MKRKFLLMSGLCLLLVSLVFTGICLAGEPYKVALVLPGPINDGGWNASGYEGVAKVQKILDFKFSYSENVTKSEQEAVLRGYAVDGYDLVIGHGFEFGDVALKIGMQFKDTFFLTTSSDQHLQEPNVGCAQLAYTQMGFSVGYIAGILTKTNKVGNISGKNWPSFVLVSDYFEKGARYYNPDIEVYSVCIDSVTDLNKAKEASLIMIEKGVDVLMGSADQASAGVALAAQEKGILYLGKGFDQHDYAPGTVVISAVYNWAKLFEEIIRNGINGELKAKYYDIGIAEGGITFTPFREFEDKLSAEKKEKILDLVEKIRSGEINVMDFHE